MTQPGSVLYPQLYPHPCPKNPLRDCAGAEQHRPFSELVRAVNWGYLKEERVQLHRTAEINGSTFRLEVLETFQVIASHL